MKNSKVKNFRTMAILVLIISGCIFWIIRVETRAAEFANKVTEYHRMLNQNLDEIGGLKSFLRSTGGATTSMINDKITMETTESVVYIDNKAITLGGSKGNVDIYLVTDRDISLTTGGLKVLPSSTTGLEINSQGKLPLTITSGNSYLELDDNIVTFYGEKSLELYSFLRFSKIILKPNEVSIGGFNGAKVTIDKTGNIWFETDEQINFSAKSDINIMSEGNIDLFGKRINFNEL